MSLPRTAIILAGGLGTRLKHLIPDLPKPMAPVAGKPFLEYVLRYLQQQGCHQVVLSVGYLHHKIQSHFGNTFENISLEYIIEEMPLGTGGGIKKCLQHIGSNSNVLIVNGDTYFPVDVQKMSALHVSANASLTIALKELTHFDRYGSVVLNKNLQVMQFNEKAYCQKGLINGGIYLCNTSIVDALPQQEKFSFETDFLNQNSSTKKIYGYVDDAYFIDIGIPEDYQGAQTEIINL